VLGAMVASRWFTERRGLVVGLFAASTATGQLIFLPIAAWMIENLGWRYAVIPVFVACVIVALLATLLMRDHPGSIGLRAFGEPDTAPVEAPPARATTLNILGPFQMLIEASRNRTFWILAGTFFICGLSTNGLIQTHFVTLCGDFGIVPVAAASMLAVMGIFDFVGTIGSGWLSDRFDNRWLLFWYYGLRGLSLVYLPFSNFTFYGLSIFAVFYGLDWIATVPPTVKIAADRFGREKAGLVFGWVFTGHQLGAATAAYGAGLTRTELNTYLPAFFVAGAFCLLAAILAITLQKSGSATKGPALAH